MTSATAAYLLRNIEGAAYVRGGTALGEPVYGISDIDLIIVVRGASDIGRVRERVRARWRRVARLLPSLELVLCPAVYEDEDLADAAGSTFLSHGLDRGLGSNRDAVALYHLQRPYADDAALRVRPGIAGPMADWCLVRGRDRRPRPSPPDAQERCVAAWLDVQYWWRWALAKCSDPTGPKASYMGVKMVSEPVRIWLALAHGEVLWSRRDALRRGLTLLPEEGPAMRHALALLDDLSGDPEPELAKALPVLIRLTQRIATFIEAELEGAGVTTVELAWGGPEELVLPPEWRSGLRPLLPDGSDPEPLPFCNWWALAVPSPPEQAFALVPGDASDRRALARGAGQQGPVHACFRAGPLLLMPAGGDPWWFASARGVQFALGDPVSFALANGRRVASFPEVRGWSARDWAHRAVAERRAWLDADVRSPAHALARLLTVARAALFLESIEEGEPVLPLTLASVAERLSERGGGFETTAPAAYDAYRGAIIDGVPASPRTVTALRRHILELPALAATPLRAGSAGARPSSPPYRAPW